MWERDDDQGDERPGNPFKWGTAEGTRDGWCGKWKVGKEIQQNVNNVCLLMVG